jgi:hypothetical protein
MYLQRLTTAFHFRVNTQVKGSEALRSIGDQALAVASPTHSVSLVFHMWHMAGTKALLCSMSLKV